MTGEEIVGAARAGWSRARPWLPIAGCVVLALLVIRGCQATRAAKAEVEQLRARSASEAKARAAGVAVVDQVDQRAMNDRAAALERDNEALRGERDRARTALGTLRARLAAHIEAPAAQVAGPAAPTQPGRAVALYMGEPLRLGADLVVDEIAGGAHVLSGTLAAMGPRGLLLRQPFSQPLTIANERAPETRAVRSGWRWGPQGGYSASGWLAGALVVTPEVRLPLVGVRMGFSAAVAGGPGGVFVLGGPTF